LDTVERTAVHDLPEEGTAERTRLMASALHRRERQAYGGGIQWEAAFFGWLAAIGLAATLAAMTVAGGVAVGATEFGQRAIDQVEELSFAGGVLLVVIVALSYAAGGYVAARMARFDGWRQGLGVFGLSLLMALAVVVAAWIAGGELNPLDSLELPTLPVDEGPLDNGAGITLAIVAGVALISAVAGGLLGERFHRAVDEAGTEIAPVPWEPADPGPPMEEDTVAEDTAAIDEDTAATVAQDTEEYAVDEETVAEEPPRN
jgi:hypothetical protein